MTKGTVLITGASSGIGEELARIFARNHYNLIITARREQRLANLAAELENDVTITPLVCDLATEKGVRSLLDSIKQQDLKVDILVNNAGVSYQGPFHQQSSDAVCGMLNLNINALTQLTHALLPGMIEAGYGKILNVSSVAAFQPGPSFAIYAASKAFVLSFTEALSEDLKGTGVTATTLCPGLTKTEMIDDVADENLIPPFMIASAKSVARQGYDALMHSEVIRIPGIANQATVNWTKYQPRWLVRNWGGMLARMYST